MTIVARFGSTFGESKAEEILRTFELGSVAQKILEFKIDPEFTLVVAADNFIKRFDSKEIMDLIDWLIT